MAENSKIEWLNGGHTASPWYGCQHAHVGCLNCYAETLAKRKPGTLGIWGPDGTRVKSKSFIGNLRKWNRAAQEAGQIHSVFPSLCDPFEDRPELEPWRREMFQVIDECQNLRLLLLTKRPENVRRMWPVIREVGTWRDMGLFRPNVYLLASISDQPTADKMVPELLKCRGLVPVLGLSVEPMLGPVDLRKGIYHNLAEQVRGTSLDGIDWVIVGGESGHGARPFDLAWARSLRDQCKAAGVPFFMKQVGSKPGYFDFQPLPGYQSTESIMRHGEYDPDPVWLNLKDKKGGDPAEWPEDLRVRDVPRG